MKSKAETAPGVLAEVSMAGALWGDSECARVFTFEFERSVDLHGNDQAESGVGGVCGIS